MPEVRPVTENELPALGAVMADAFATDPVWQWVASPRVDYRTRAAAWFTAELNGQVRGHGEVLVDDDLRGGAIWSPPKRWKATAAEGFRLIWPSLRFFHERFGRGLRLVSAVERVHPPEPHWYLALLGTDPNSQGSGVGSALVEAVTSRCDEQGLGAYLESSKEENLAFYARHGFVVRGEIELPNGPSLWPMWRDPKG